MGLRSNIAKCLVVGVMVLGLFGVKVNAGDSTFPGRGSLGGDKQTFEYEQYRCFKGDGTTCLAHGRHLYLAEEESDFGGYRRALDHGCFVKNNDMKIKLNDSAGREVMFISEREQTEKFTKTLNITEFAKGIYFINLITEEGNMVRRIVVR